LTEVAETAKDPKCRTKAQSLAKAVMTYKFVVIWYNLLNQINVVRKLMQANACIHCHAF